MEALFVFFGDGKGIFWDFEDFVFFGILGFWGFWDVWKDHIGLSSGPGS